MSPCLPDIGGSNVTLSNVTLSEVEGAVEGSHSKETRNSHINIGTGLDISISDLATLIKQTIGFTGDFVYNTSKPDGTLKKLTDVSKLHQLGWKHQTELEKGIVKMIEWYKFRKH